MKCVEIFDRDAWEAFVSTQPFAQFTQSWIWGEFQASLGKKVRRFAISDEALDPGSRWLAVIQIQFHARRFGFGYWVAPRGPIFSSSVPIEKRQDVMFFLCEELLKMNELRKKSLFWRFEPFVELEKPEGILPLSFYRNDSMNPSSTYVIALGLGAYTPDSLLERMHEKTRYNIHISEKHGVMVRMSTHPADMGIFLRLLNETAKRDGFLQHSELYLRKTFEFLSGAGMARLRFAEKNGVILCANMEILYGDTVTYLYGASSSLDRKSMAPYAIQWSAICNARSEGYARYDMWGANPPTQGMYYYKKSWEGITRFKKGWGGELINFVGTWDLPFNRFLYRLAYMSKFFRG